jgi:hypothetical protein
MPKKSTNPIRELRVIFDTNPLYTQVPNELVNTETRTLIQANSAHPDLKIAWHIPEIVTLERHHQMVDQAQQLLPGFVRMNALLGLTVSLAPEQLHSKIGSVIEAELATLNICKAPLDTNKVDWNRVMHDAAFRKAPFQAGKTEKGFRDAMILEAFVQLIEGSPTSASRCRLALVTNDGLLGAAAKERAASHTNAEVLANLEELRNLINTLISTADEAFIKELREKAKKMFFVPKDDTTLYYRENIYDKIRAGHADTLQVLPPGADGLDQQGVMVAWPRFIKKEQQRVHWSTQVTFNASAYKKTYASIPAENVTSDQTLAALLGTNTAAQPLSGLLGLGAHPGPFTITNTATQYPYLGSSLLDTASYTKTPIAKGARVFDVAWSATVGSHKKLVHPKIDGISYVDTTWE